MLFRLVHYFDVWGNAKEGFEINNWCEEAIIRFRGWPSELVILRRLKKIGFIKNTARRNSMRFDHDTMCTIVIEERNGRPVCSLEDLTDEMKRFGKEEYKPYHLEAGRKIYD